jgi:hypothetical protein
MNKLNQATLDKIVNQTVSKSSARQLELKQQMVQKSRRCSI